MELSPSHATPGIKIELVTTNFNINIFKENTDFIVVCIELAISPNSPEVHIYQLERGEWKLEEILKEHDLKVTGIDWAPKTNRYC